jgi:hypothetical protein
VLPPAVICTLGWEAERTAKMHPICTTIPARADPIVDFQGFPRGEDTDQAVRLEVRAEPGGRQHLDIPPSLLRRHSVDPEVEA